MSLLTIMSALVLLAYPFTVYFGLQYFSLSTISAVLGIIFIVRIISSKNTRFKALKNIALLTGAVGITLAILGVLFKQHNWLTFYPVIVNLVMFSVFAFSLKQQQNIIECFARTQDPNLPEEAIAYTRKVTKLWCGFFVINGTIALITCFMSLKIWTLYNGFISYILIGTLMGTEWLVRQWIKRKA